MRASSLGQVWVLHVRVWLSPCGLYQALPSAPPSSGRCLARRPSAFSFPLRKGERTWDGMRWDEVEKSWEDMRWVEMRWDDTDCGDNGMQWAISKRSRDAMRSDEMRKIQDSKDMSSDWQVKRACCCDAQKACSHPIGPVFAPLYRPQAFQFWNSCPWLAREIPVYVFTHTHTHIYIYCAMFCTSLDM